MDRTRLRRFHLAQAERHVAAARRNVEHQRGIVVTLVRDGHRAARAMQLLGLFEELLDLQIQARDQLKARLPRRQPNERL